MFLFLNYLIPIGYQNGPMKISQTVTASALYKNNMANLQFKLVQPRFFIKLKHEKILLPDNTADYLCINKFSARKNFI
jgi:hypothetical protein